MSEENNLTPTPAASKKADLKKKLTGFVTVWLIPIASLVISIVIYYASVEHKELTVTGLQMTPLVEAKREIAKNVVVVYNKDTVVNTARFLFEVKNSGDKSITSDDVKVLTWLAPADFEIVDFSLNNTNLKSDEIIQPSLVGLNALKLNVSVLNKGVSRLVSVLCISKKIPTSYQCGLRSLIVDCNVINRVNQFQSNSKVPFWQQVFYGSWVINLVKGLIFFLIGFALFITVLAIYFKVQDRRELAKLKKEEEEKQRATEQQRKKKEQEITELTHKVKLALDTEEFENIQVDYPYYFSETYKALEKLSKKELIVLRKVLKYLNLGFEESLDFIKANALSEEEQVVLTGMMNKELKSVLQFRAIHYTSELAEYFLTNKITNYKAFIPKSNTATT